MKDLHFFPKYDSRVFLQPRELMLSPPTKLKYKELAQRLLRRKDALDNERGPKELGTLP